MPAQDPASYMDPTWAHCQDNCLQKSEAMERLQKSVELKFACDAADANRINAEKIVEMVEGMEHYRENNMKTHENHMKFM